MEIAKRRSFRLLLVTIVILLCVSGASIFLRIKSRTVFADFDVRLPQPTAFLLNIPVSLYVLVFASILTGLVAKEVAITNSKVSLRIDGIVLAVVLVWIVLFTALIVVTMLKLIGSMM